MSTETQAAEAVAVGQEEAAGDPDPHHLRPLVAAYLRRLQVHVEQRDVDYLAGLTDPDVRGAIYAMASRRTGAFIAVIQLVEREEV